jgi:hypothetical protein
MVYSREHPFPGQPHPWTDPLAPQDFLTPRPDWALQTAGAIAPRPEDFPLTDMGKRDYYAAVEQAAYQQMAMQQQMLQQQGMARQQHEAEAIAKQRRDHILLLRR